LVELYTVATTEPSFTKHISVTGLVFEDRENIGSLLFIPV
jgi:hypothetical protein